MLARFTEGSQKVSGILSWKLGIVLYVAPRRLVSKSSIRQLSTPLIRTELLLTRIWCALDECRVKFSKNRYFAKSGIFPMECLCFFCTVAVEGLGRFWISAVFTLAT